MDMRRPGGRDARYFYVRRTGVAHGSYGGWSQRPTEETTPMGRAKKAAKRAPLGFMPALKGQR